VLTVIIDYADDLGDAIKDAVTIGDADSFSNADRLSNPHEHSNLVAIANRDVLTVIINHADEFADAIEDAVTVADADSFSNADCLRDRYYLANCVSYVLAAGCASDGHGELRLLAPGRLGALLRERAGAGRAGAWSVRGAAERLERVGLLALAAHERAAGRLDRGQRGHERGRGAPPPRSRAARGAR